MSKKLAIIFLFIFLFIFLGIYSFLAYSYFKYPINYENIIKNYSQKYNIKAEFVASVINTESGFKIDAISSKGAIGLMQIMPNTAEWLSGKLKIKYKKEYLFNADFNINLGTYYLSYLFNKFNDKIVVLCAYNAGEGIVKNWLNNKNYSSDGKTLNIIPFSQTNMYVNKVLKDVKIYQKKIK